VHWAPHSHHVGGVGQALHDAPPAEVGVGGERFDVTLVELLAGVDVGEVDTTGAQVGQPRHEVVALDVRDGGVESEAFRQRPHGFCAAGRVETAGVRHDLDASIETGAENVLELCEEGLGEPAVGVLGLVLGEDEHGQLGQPVTGEHVDGAAVDHLARRRQPIAVEPAAIGHPQRIGHETASRRTST
jgi:hypothetical protein